MPFEVTFGAQPYDATARRAAVTADRQCMVEAGDDHPHKTVTPKLRVEAPGTP